MATVTKRGDSYRIRASAGYDASGRQVTKSMTWKPEPGMTKRQIENELNRQKTLFEDKIKGGQYATEQVKFEVLAREWMAQTELEGNLKKSTINRLKQTQERTFASLGHLYMHKITTRQIQAFINSLSEDGVNKRTGGGMSTKSQQLYLNFISDVFQYALKNGIVTQNPCRNVSTIKKAKLEREMFTPEQASDFLLALEEAPLKYQAFFSLAIYGGFRRGEILGLRWSDIDFENRIISINRTAYYDDGHMMTAEPKTKTSCRTLKLPEVVFQALREHKTEQLKDRLKLGDAWNDFDWVFTSWDGNPMGETTAINWLKKFCTAHGLPKVCIHSFRHLNASLLISAGANPRSVSSALGHSDPTFTMKQYAHAFQEQQAKASEAVAEALNFKRKA